MKNVQSCTRKYTGGGRKKRNTKKKGKRKQGVFVKSNRFITINGSNKTKTQIVNEKNKKYGFLIITTHGAHEQSLPKIKLPYDIVALKSAPLGYSNYRIGDDHVCDTNYNNIITKIKGILKVRRPKTKSTQTINLSLENIILQLNNMMKRTNVMPDNLNEYNRSYVTSHDKRFQVYELNRGDKFLDKYYSYERHESPSANDIQSISDNRVCLIYLDENNKIVEEDLNIAMNQNENGLRGFSLGQLLMHIKRTYSDPVIKFDKLFMIDMSCDVIWSNRNNVEEKNANNRNIRYSRKDELALATKIQNNRFTPSRVTRSSQKNI